MFTICPKCSILALLLQLSHYIRKFCDQIRIVLLKSIIYFWGGGGVRMPQHTNGSQKATWRNQQYCTSACRSYIPNKGLIMGMLFPEPSYLPRSSFTFSTTWKSECHSSLITILIWQEVPISTTQKYCHSFVFVFPSSVHFS